MSGLSHTTQITANQQVAFTQMDEDIVMMGPDNGLFYGVNSIGAEIWTLLKSGAMSLDAIYNHIQQRYDVDEAQCLADVNQFVDRLRAEGFITVITD